MNLSENQDGHQNGRHLSFCTTGHSTCNLVYYPISSKFHILTTFIKLLFMSDFGFCPMNDNQNCRQMDIPFSLQGIMRALCRSPTVLVVVNLLS